MQDAIVQINGLSYHYGRQTVLNNISLTVPQGSIYGFLGANGAGKTTTLRLLLGLLQKQTGSVTILGSDIRQNRVNILSRIGSLIEQPSLYLHLSGKENLEIFRLSYQCNKNRIGEVLKMVGLSDAGRKKAKAYSLGMKQRLAIAVALLHDPELLILDEPTNGLDPNGIIEIRELIKELNKNHGKTIILSSHLLHEIEKTVTDVAIIHKGNIVFQNSLEQLLAVKAHGSVIEMEVNDNQRAKQLLQSDYTVTMEKDKVKIPYESKEQVGKIVALLTYGSVQVYQINISQNDLENLFIQITSA